MHVQDISHPDWKNQVDTVDSTLRMLGCGRESIIQVANKVDKLSEEQVEACGMDAYQISATTGQGKLTPFWTLAWKYTSPIFLR